MHHETSIRKFEFVRGFNPKQRFHQIHQLDYVATTCQIFLSSTLQDHEKLRKKTINKLFNKKTHIPLVKNNVFLSMHYLMLATLFGHFVPVCTCKMFDFRRHDPRALQI